MPPFPAALTRSLLLTGILMTSALAATAQDDAAFTAALVAPGPADVVPAGSDIYAPLLGHWQVQVTDHLPDGTERTIDGEVLFARVLEGRAVQDLWIFPGRDARGSDTPRAGNRFGTTLRVYHPERDAWIVDWFNPVTGVHTRLTGTQSDDGILQEGEDGEGRPIRWIFTDVTDTAFHWRGERSDDDGRTWVLETEFSARR